jgi:hypothetical protein
LGLSIPKQSVRCSLGIPADPLDMTCNVGCRRSDAFSARSTADVPEIQISPAMVEAGLIPLLRFHRERSDDEDVVREIYLAMRRAEI